MTYPRRSTAMRSRKLCVQRAQNWKRSFQRTPGRPWRSLSTRRPETFRVAHTYPPPSPCPRRVPIHQPIPSQSRGGSRSKAARHRAGRASVAGNRWRESNNGREGWGFAFLRLVTRHENLTASCFSLRISSFAFRVSKLALPQCPPCCSAGREKNPKLSGVGNCPNRE